MVPVGICSATTSSGNLLSRNHRHAVRYEMPQRFAHLPRLSVCNSFVIKALYYNIFVIQTSYICTSKDLKGHNLLCKIENDSGAKRPLLGRNSIHARPCSVQGPTLLATISPQVRERFAFLGESSQMGLLPSQCLSLAEFSRVKFRDGSAPAVQLSLCAGTFGISPA